MKNKKILQSGAFFENQQEKKIPKQVKTGTSKFEVPVFYGL